MQELTRRRLLKRIEGASRRPERFDPDQLYAELTSFSRQPFVEILSEMLQCIPTADALQEFADSHPDRWANAVNTMGKLAGYEQGMDIEGNVLRDITKLGDAQLMQRLAEVEGKLKEMGEEATVIDAQVLEVDKEKEADPT
tara:strand:+ start:45 stop:467 length:423 start_codon:yes stop_codon:yes gene_type:complete